MKPVLDWATNGRSGHGPMLRFSSLQDVERLGLGDVFKGACTGWVWVRRNFSNPPFYEGPWNVKAGNVANVRKDLEAFLGVDGWTETGNPPMLPIAPTT